LDDVLIFRNAALAPGQALALPRGIAGAERDHRCGAGRHLGDSAGMLQRCVVPVMTLGSA
jgi:hypothetical protein